MRGSNYCPAATLYHFTVIVAGGLTPQERLPCPIRSCRAPESKIAGSRLVITHCPAASLALIYSYPHKQASG
jgi:hypothetical protein